MPPLADQMRAFTHRGNYTFVSTYALDAIPEMPLEAGCHFYADDAL